MLSSIRDQPGHDKPDARQIPKIGRQWLHHFRLYGSRRLRRIRMAESSNFLAFAHL